MAASESSAAEYSTQLRNQYLSWAQQVLNKPDLDYNSLYRQFADNPWACEQLDQKVAALALSHQYTPTQAAYLMAQSPHAQYEINERGAEPETLIPYAKSVVSHSLAMMRSSQPSAQALWKKYSQGVEAAIPAQQTQAVIRKALRDGQTQEAIALMLKADPQYRQIESSQGEAKASQYLQLAIQAAVRLEKAGQQDWSSARQTQARRETELE